MGRDSFLPLSEKCECLLSLEVQFCFSRRLSSYILQQLPERGREALLSETCVWEISFGGSRTGYRTGWKGAAGLVGRVTVTSVALGARLYLCGMGNIKPLEEGQ